MNTRNLLCACAAAAAMMISAMPVMANTPTPTKANVPFAFVASGKAMPAGQYTLAKNSENVLSVRSATGDNTFAVVTRQVGPMNGASRPRLVFVKKNGQYHLSEIYLLDTVGGQEIPVK